MPDELTRKTENGDVAAQPSIEDILGKMGIKGGWAGIHQTAAATPMADSLKETREQLHRDYQATFATEHGRRVLEDLLDHTLRRAPVKPSEGMTFEQLTPYVVERNGQNSTVFYVCKMVEAGRKLGSAASAKKKKAA